MMTTAVLRCGAREDIAQRALDLLVSQLGMAIGVRGEAHLALTGGSSAAALFALLRDGGRAGRVDWRHVHVWQGDERFVPHDHPDSNWAGALRGWLDAGGGSTVPPTNRHPIPVDEALREGHDESWAASRYTDEIMRHVPQRHGQAAFDVILLGVGGDGHILSAFPETPALREVERVAVAVEAPSHIEPHRSRVTLTPLVLGPAGLVLVMVPGAGKAEVVGRCFGFADDPMIVPALFALRPNAVWLLEPESAARV